MKPQKMSVPKINASSARQVTVDLTFSKPKSVTSAASVAAWLESMNEFTDDLELFLKSHPFVQAHRIKPPDIADMKG